MQQIFNRLTYDTHMNKEVMKAIWSAIVACVIAILTAIGAAYGLTSCKATRTITTDAKCIQKGDSTVVIQTKVTENYVGVKK